MKEQQKKNLLILKKLFKTSLLIKHNEDLVCHENIANRYFANLTKVVFYECLFINKLMLKPEKWSSQHNGRLDLLKPIEVEVKCSFHKFV